MVFAFAEAAEAENGIQHSTITTLRKTSVILFIKVVFFIKYLPYRFFNTYFYTTKMLCKYVFSVNVVTFCN